MKKLSVVLILFAVMLCCMKGETVAVETGVYHGEAITCTSTDPYIGSNFIVINPNTQKHDFFGTASYDTAFVEKQLTLMEGWDMRYVRVFDGNLLSAENTFLAGVQANITDFLNRAQNHGLTVFFTFTTVESWMYSLYYQRTGGGQWTWDETEYNTAAGRTIYGDKIKYVTQQCFASRSEDMVIALRNEAFFHENMPLFGLTRDQLAVAWTNEMDAKVRSVDTRANHKVAVGMIQCDVDQPEGYDDWIKWSAPAIYGWTTIEIVDIHFYSITDDTWEDEFDDAYGWWTPYCQKEIVLGELGYGMYRSTNSKYVAEKTIDLIHHIRNDNRYSGITDVMFWTFAPYYKTYNMDNSYHGLTDGYTGFTRVGVSLWYDQYVAETCSANYSVYSSYGTANLSDYDESTRCILQHVPSVAYPSNYEINFNGQWYCFHKIRIVDKTAPYPRDFKVYVYNGGWQLFGTVTNNTAQTVDVVTTAASGWMSGCKVKVEVTNEVNNWSSLHEIYINPVTIVTE